MVLSLCVSMVNNFPYSKHPFRACIYISTCATHKKGFCRCICARARVSDAGFRYKIAFREFVFFRVRTRAYIRHTRRAQTAFIIFITLAYIICMYICRVIWCERIGRLGQFMRTHATSSFDGLDEKQQIDFTSYFMTHTTPD